MRNVNLKSRGFGQLPDSTVPVSRVLENSDLQLLSLLLEEGSGASAGNPRLWIYNLRA